MGQGRSHGGRSALVGLACVFGALTAIAFGGGAARATLVRSFTLSELVGASDAILVGEVAWQEASWDPARREIYTLSWIRVSERWDGAADADDYVVLKQIGGVLDGVERHVVGTAPLAIGDELVLFARNDGAFHYAVGMAQGVFQIARTAGAPAAVQRGALPGLAPPAAGSPLRPLPPEATQLATLRAAVKTLLRERHAEVTP